MLPDSPDDEDSTVFCQTCSEWCHPRSSCARDPGHETAPLPVMKLRREGPLDATEFTGTSLESKNKHGIAKFDLTAHSSGTNSTFGPTGTIYYLNHEHKPTKVLEKWVSVNKDILKGRELTTESVTRALSKTEFKKAWSRLCEKREFEVLNTPNHSDRGGDHYQSEDCPFCGESVKSLPSHLPSCSAQ